MKEPRDPWDCLDDLSDAIKKAIAFVRGMDYAGFLCDEKTIYAVVRALEIVGEATKLPSCRKSNRCGTIWRGNRDSLLRIPESEQLASRLSSTLLRLHHKPVTRVADCKKMLGLGGVRLEGLAQPADKLVGRPGLHVA